MKAEGLHQSSQFPDGPDRAPWQFLLRVRHRNGLGPVGMLEQVDASGNPVQYPSCGFKLLDQLSALHLPLLIGVRGAL